MDLERLHLSRVDSLDIIDFVKKSVEILMSMREDEFINFNKNWQLQEQLRLSKQKPTDLSAEPSKKYRTPKNSRFFAKMKKETETLATPKTNKKRLLKITSSSVGKHEEEDDLVEYEAQL